jgi:hypothetical protein
MGRRLVDAVVVGKPVNRPREVFTIKAATASSSTPGWPSRTRQPLEAGIETSSILSMVKRT